MKRLIILSVIAVLGLASATAQSEGDHYTAGYSNSRHYLNSGIGDFTPPLTPSGSFPLSGFTAATTLMVFESGGSHHMLVGQENGPAVEYQLFSASDGAAEWTQPVSLAGVTGLHRYQPAFSNGIVLLGGATSTAVQAVQVSTGSTLWQDTSLGSSNGRFPVLTNGLALFHGQDGVVGLDPQVGPAGGTFFQWGVSTAEAPLSVSGQQGYLLDGSGTLHAFRVADGSEVWSLAGVPSVRPNLIATEKYVFLNTSFGALGALSAADGSGIWGKSGPILSETPSMALAYGHLYLFVADDGEGQCGLDVLQADTGALLWSARETGTGIDFGTVVNNVVYYYNQTDQSIQARDAFTGNLIWSERVEGVLGLSFADSRLFVLFGNRVDVFLSQPIYYFAHIADGGGQRTLITLSNPGAVEVNGTLDFFGTDGLPLNLHIVGGGTTASVEFVVPPGGSARIQTLGEVDPRAGWARVRADGRLAGSAIFQYATTDGSIANEAGVADSKPAALGTVYVATTRPPDVPLVIDTGIAVANTSGESTLVEITLLDESGTELGQALSPLGPGEQKARFLSQLFPAEAAQTFVGSLVIRAQRPVVVTALRTQAGLQLSSYPVGR